MHIRINLPREYHELNQLKKDNYPYRVMFSSFMEEVANLANQEDLTPIQAIGRIEYSLATQYQNETQQEAPQLNLTSNGDADNISVDYVDDNETVRDFYADADMTNKQLTLMLLRLMLRLYRFYGPSLAVMIWKIRELENGTTSVAMQPVSEMPIAEAKVEPIIRKRKISIPDKAPSNEVQSSSAAVSAKASVDRLKEKADKMTKPAKKRKVTKAPIIDTTETKSAAPKTVTTSDTPSISSAASSLDSLVATAEALNNEAKDIEGSVVTKNPLMDDFFGK